MKGCKSLVGLVGLGLWVWCCWILVWLVLQGWLCLAEGCKSEAILQLPLQGEAGSEYRQIVKGGTSGVLTLAISVNDLSLSLQYLHFSALLSFWAPEMVADKSPIRPRQQKRTEYIQLISAARYMHGIRCCPQLLCSIRLPWDGITYMSMYRWRCLDAIYTHYLNLKILTWGQGTKASRLVLILLPKGRTGLRSKRRKRLMLILMMMTTTTPLPMKMKMMMMMMMMMMKKKKKKIETEMAKLYLPSNHGPGVELNPGLPGGRGVEHKRLLGLGLSCCLSAYSLLKQEQLQLAQVFLKCVKRPLSTIFICFLSESTWTYEIGPPISGPPDFGLARKSRPRTIQWTEMRNLDRKTRSIFNGSSPTCQTFSCKVQNQSG